MPEDIQTIDQETHAAPARRFKDAASLNSVIKAMIIADGPSSLARVDVQEMLDGAPPLSDEQLRLSGQEGRCNLNFGDGKARVKSEAAGYYDLTTSVPMMARIRTEWGDESNWSYNSNVISEEFHRMVKDWKAFHPSFQLLVQKFTSHGLGFLYFNDDIDWRWSVAGLDEFKLPRSASIIEDSLDMAVVCREITVGNLWAWMNKSASDDTRWNRTEVGNAILRAHDPSSPVTPILWEQWQQMAKNNDYYASAVAKTNVSLAHCWVREFSGKVSYYLTLRDGSNADYLFKCEGLFDCIDNCFTFFPYEVGSNGSLHSIRGLGHEIYAAVQVLNSLRGQTVDNAKLSGSLLLQPTTETSAEDMAILFYGGATYIPPNVKVQNGKLENPSQGILPIIQDMTMTLRRNTGDVLSSKGDTSNDRTKFEVAAELTKEAVLPTANLDLFYEPWGRHLAEVWRRCRRKDVNAEQPGGQAILDMRARCEKRGVPKEAIFEADHIVPMRAVGYGSPTNRLLAFDEFMQYYGSLDPVGQNNLLRDRFAQKVGYAQVDDYVPRIDKGMRAPQDQEIAELQNFAMSAGKPMTVRGNDNHIIHLQTHFPDLEADLEALESNQGSPDLVAIVQLKLKHDNEHAQLLKPDKLQKDIVAELKRQYNNLSQRVEAAVKAAETQAANAPAQAAGQPAGPSPKAQEMQADAEIRRQILVTDAQLRQNIRASDAEQKRSIRDADAASKLQLQMRRLFPAPSAPAAPAAPAEALAAA